MNLNVDKVDNGYVVALNLRTAPEVKRCVFYSRKELDTFISEALNELDKRE
ncbi:hypothetical protein LCGC14_1458820 [marine sediment metagenome]|uniref:Uncharacterized protein n=1 Tax=marine sediment metagenome TaxID=412755 RepID=A0A0F9K1T3_9ZZZZ